MYVGRLRSVGSIKLHVSFAKEPYKRDDILQKRYMANDMTKVGARVSSRSHPISFPTCSTQVLQLFKHVGHDEELLCQTCSKLLKIISLFCRISSLL